MGFFKIATQVTDLQVLKKILHIVKGNSDFSALITKSMELSVILTVPITYHWIH